MIGKSAGAIPCAHCKQLGAALACPGCERQVCGDCYRSWDGCTVPHARAFQLPPTYRLWQCDGTGRFAIGGRMPSLVQRMFRVWPVARAFDLHTGAALSTSARIAPLSPAHCHVDRRGRVRWVRWRPGVGGWGYALCTTSIDGDRGEVIDLEHEYVGFTRDDDKMWHVDGSQLILRDLTANLVSRVPGLPPRVQCADLDDWVRDHLAVATWSEVRVYRVDRAAETLTLLGQVELSNETVESCRISGYKLAVVTSGRRRRLRLYQLDLDGGLEQVEDILSPPRRGSLAYDISDDGLYFAYAFEEPTITVINLFSGAREELAGHGAAIERVRLTDDAARLITADASGHVIVRPQVELRYVDRVVQIDAMSAP